jgi:hypothetical protein
LIFGAWGRPPDGPSTLFAIAGALLVIASLHPALSRIALAGLARVANVRTKTPWSIALGAALLSLAYVAWYLRGGPRIVDATTYFLQARALAHGHFAFDVPDPSASFRGRFLLYDDHHLAGIFPPGYPLVLSIGFLFGAPLVIGPLIAFAIAIVTSAIARELGADDRTATFAAILSLVCAALRYHTADTMSHGAAALGLALAVVFALRGSPLLSGLALGWLVSTRIPTGGAAAITLGFIAWRSRGPRGVLHLALGAVPGILLLFASQKAATGSFFSLTQSTYYARSDGPPGCFRMGFGTGIGCVFEHGDVVHAGLKEGFGLTFAIVTTAQRLWRHCDDVLDGWPLLLLMLPSVAKTVRALPVARLLAAIIGLQVLAYAPFYFSGNYPGGGARHLADVIPIEHALVAVSLARSTWPFDAFERRALALGGAAIFFFGVHVASAHVQLRDRDGGRPMFEPDEMDKAGAHRGLVFVDTDHGFSLAHDPGATVPEGLVAARWRDDGHDRLLWERLKSPPTYLYRFGREPPVSSWVPPAASDEQGRESWRFEGESDWPPLSQTGGYAIPVWASTTCASNGRVLDVVPTEPTAVATIALPVPRAARWRITPRILRRAGDGTGTVRLLDRGRKTLAEWPIPAFAGADPSCFEPAGIEVELGEGDLTLAIEAKNGRLGLDRTVLTPAAIAP